MRHKELINKTSRLADSDFIIRVRHVLINLYRFYISHYVTLRSYEV